MFTGSGRRHKLEGSGTQGWKSMQETALWVSECARLFDCLSAKGRVSAEHDDFADGAILQQSGKTQTAKAQAVNQKRPKPKHQNPASHLDSRPDPQIVGSWL